MLILAGVSISAINGTGIFIKTKEATDRYNNSVNIEGEAINNIISQIDNLGGDNNGETPIVSDGSWNGKINTPKLVEGMTAVAWDSNNNEIIPTTQNEWYNYVAQTGPTDNGGTSKWANAKTTNGNYLVWIPRYEYKITSGEHTSTAGTIDVRFIPVTTTYTPDANGVERSPDGYIIPPAFTSITNNGGWDSEIAGFWVGKFESSNDGSGNIQIIPNVKAWTSISVNDIFTKCKTFSTSDNVTGDSHMMKNSEWGAVAYLAHSKYGRNGTEVTINVNTNYKTGFAGYTTDAYWDETDIIELSATDTMGTNPEASAWPYNNNYRGVLASTTGNIYGIYDMNGGVQDTVAAYVDNNNVNLNTYCLSLKNETNLKYKDVYKASASDGTSDTAANNYALTSNKVGDAMYETSTLQGIFPGWAVR